jgi:hypothetical protein
MTERRTDPTPGWDRPPRRVITGQDGTGHSFFSAVNTVTATTAASRPGFGWYRFWGAESIPRLPHDGSFSVGDGGFPPPGGLRVIQVVIPAGAGVDEQFDREAFRREWSEAVPSPTSRLRESHGSGQHATESIDIGFVLRGEVGLELDGGAEETLREGDVFVQNGTRHVWRNRSGAPCLIGLVLVGGFSKDE